MLETAYRIYTLKEKTNLKTTVTTVLNTYKFLLCTCVMNKEERASVPKGLMITESTRQRVTQDGADNEEVTRSPYFPAIHKTTYQVQDIPRRRSNNLD